MLLSNEIPEADKPFYALSYFYDSMPDNLDVAIDKMLWFYRCGDESYKAEKKYYKCMKKVHKIKSKALPAPDRYIVRRDFAAPQCTIRIYDRECAGGVNGKLI